MGGRPPPPHRRLLIIKQQPLVRGAEDVRGRGAALGQRQLPRDQLERPVGHDGMEATQPQHRRVERKDVERRARDGRHAELGPPRVGHKRGVVGRPGGADGGSVAGGRPRRAGGEGLGHVDEARIVRGGRVGRQRLHVEDRKSVV